MQKGIVFGICMLVGVVATARSAAAQEQPSNSQIGRAVSAALEELSEIGRSYADLFDPAILATSLPSDPEAIKEWVAENTALVPYVGSLKGGSGVLIDREGNSLDRALLLAFLLEEKGFQTRLSRATLSDGQVQLLYGSGVPSRAPPLPSVEPFDADSVEQLLSGPGELPRDFARSLIDDTVAQTEENRANVTRRLASVLPTFLEATNDLERPIAYDVTPSRHWWVDVREADEWRALDPSVSALGVPLEPEETFPTGGSGAPEDLPPEVHHRVALSVVVEVTSDEKVEETTLVSLDRPASELATSVLAVSFFPVGLDDVSAETDLEGALLSAKSWVPVINMENDEIVGLGINIDGTTQDSREIKSTGGFGGLGVDLGGMLGGLNSEIGGGLGTSPSTPKPEDRITGMWLRVETRIPGRETEQDLRVIFDASPVTPPGHSDRSAALAALPADEDGAIRLERTRAMLGVHKLGVATARWPETYHAMRTAQSLEFLAPAMKAIGNGANMSEDAGNEFARIAHRASSKLLEYNFQRWALNPSADRLYVDGPSIAFEHIIFTSGPKGVGVINAFDIVRNEVAVRGSPDVDSFSERVAQGVTDTVAESVYEDEVPRISNTARLHEQLAGKEWSLLMPGDKAPDNGAPRLAMALQQGRAVLLPISNLDRGLWWEIDVANGTTIGMSETGRGDAVEFVLEQAAIPYVYCGLTAFALGVLHASNGGPSLSETFDQTGREVAIWSCALATIGVPGLGWMLKLKKTKLDHVQGIAGAIIKLAGTYLLLYD